MTRRALWTALFLVFLVSFTSLGMEITLTRIFSLIFSYYYLFLSLSIALCGIGIGGCLVSMMKITGSRITLVSTFLSITFVVSVILPLKIAFFLSHPLILAIVFLPSFVITGLLIALIFKLYNNISGLVYGSDLLGAGIGSLAIVVLLRWISPLNIIVIFSLVIILASYLVSRKTYLLVMTCLLAIFLVFNQHHRLLDIPYGRIPITTETKALASCLQNPRIKGQIERTYWSSSFRTDIVRQDLLPGSRGIFIDGGAPTVMYQFNGDLNTVKWLRNTITYLPFQIANKDRALCIGPGGGADILLALLADVREIDAVEVNDCIPKILRDYRDFNGHILENKQVNFISDEGRSFLKGTDKRYDIIYLALAQTKTSSRSGLPLVESYLHTRNAYEDYIAHLNPGGIVAMLCETKPFLQRMILNALLALKRGDRDLQGCKKHIAIIANPILNSSYKYLMLIRREEFTPETAEMLYDHMANNGFHIYYCPYIQDKNFIPLASFRDIAGYVRGIKRTQGIDISPTTDDKPLFYDLSPFAPSFLYILFSVPTLLALITMLGTKRRMPIRVSTFFILLGLGYMLIEVSLTQKFLFFLGTPLTTFSVILVSMLSGSGAGGICTQKIHNPLRRLPLLSAMISILLLLLFLFLSKAFLKGFALSGFGKTLASFIALFGLGFLMGMPFPIIIRLVGRISTPHLGYMWAINGLMSVSGNCLAIIIAKGWGINYSLLLACLIYAVITLLSFNLMSLKGQWA